MKFVVTEFNVSIVL